MTALDPVRARQLIAEAKEDDAAIPPAPWSAEYPGGVLGGGMVVSGDTLINMRSHETHQLVARLRNNLRPLADQLEAALAEVERLRARVADEAST